MLEIVVATLEGYSPSRSPIDLSSLVMDKVLRIFPAEKIISRQAKAIFANDQVTRTKKFIAKEVGEDRVLLCVGKSLGARNIVRALNKLENCTYKRSALLTIDPNWPLWNNLTPNLNNEFLDLNYPIHKAVNIYAECPASMQAGAQLRSTSIAFNYPCKGYDHQSIIRAPEVKRSLESLIRYLGGI